MVERRRAAGAALRRRFDEAARDLGSTLDVEQGPAADQLSDLGAGLLRDAAERRSAWLRLYRRRVKGSGVYLHGPVGRGKTWLAEVLLEQLPAGTGMRLHAYDAARQLHRAVAARAGGGGGVDAAINDVLGDVGVLLLDELHAHEPGDAMLLSRLIRAMPAHGVRLVATSNYAPSGLLPDPRYHHLVLPLVEALESTCEVIEVAGPVDHRAAGHGGARPWWSSGGWLVPGSPAQLGALGLPSSSPEDRRLLQVGGRPLWAMAVIQDQVHLHFTELCEARTSAGDLLELAERYRTLVLSGVPRLSTTTPDARRRFGNLVDVCWDRDVRLVVLSTHSTDAVLDAPLADIERTASRVSLLRTA